LVEEPTRFFNLSDMDAPPKLEQIGNALSEALRTSILESPEPHALAFEEKTWEAMFRHLFAEEFQCRVEVDHAARIVAETLLPPRNASPKVRYYLAYRIQCALDFFGMLFPPDAKTSPFTGAGKDWSRRQIIEWLLIDLWVRRHDHWMKLNAIGVYGPFAFYGIEPSTEGIQSPIPEVKPHDDVAHPRTIEDAIKDPKNHWQALATLLINALADVSIPKDGRIPWIPGWLARIPTDEIQAADECAKSFSENWRWPTVTGNVRYQLYFRTLFASQYAMEQGQRGNPPPRDGVPWKETLLSLLIDKWRSDGGAWAKAKFPGRENAPSQAPASPFDPASN
jgi:hypothetical protein